MTKAHAVAQSATPPQVFIVSGKPCAPSVPHSQSHLFQDIFGFQCGPCAQCSSDCGKVTEMGPCSVQPHLAPPQHLPVTDHVTNPRVKLEQAMSAGLQTKPCTIKHILI